MIAGLADTGHRPYPPPARPWIMVQRWHDLLFAHWPLPPEAVQAAIPEPLELDLYDGSAWVGVIPFTMSGVRLRWTPPIPRLSAFPELNVRTYVRYRECIGVYFFSLDAGSRLAVAAARRWYRLPYFRARIHVERHDGAVDYASRRTHTGAHPARLETTYWADGGSFLPAPDSLDRWLLERYRLLTVWEGCVLGAEIHHPPWCLRPAQADIRINTMTEGLGIRLPDIEPRLVFAERQNVVVWPPRLTP